MVLQMCFKYSKQLEDNEHPSKPKIDNLKEHTDYGFISDAKSKIHIVVCRQLTAKCSQHIYMERICTNIFLLFLQIISKRTWFTDCLMH